MNHFCCPAAPLSWLSTWSSPRAICTLRVGQGPLHRHLPFGFVRNNAFAYCPLPTLVCSYEGFRL